VRAGKPHLLVRHYQAGQKPTERVFERPLMAPLKGLPAVAADAVVLPLADGNLVRQSLRDTRTWEGGPTWLADQRDEEAQCYVVAVGGGDFLVRDGGRGLARWSWSTGTDYTQETKGELPSRILSPPLPLPRADADADLLVCVADTEKRVTLWRDNPLQKKKPGAPGAWEKVRTWEFPKRITAGPFLRGSFIGCVLERRSLVWI